MNEFINYLNSMNNADANNLNALAESQVTNKYYDCIRVERKLGKFIINKIKENEKNCFIITGHAGDGKTSILAQILKDLELLEPGQKLKEYDVAEKNGISVEYMKDMSELSEEQQIQYLKEGLEAPEKGRNSILISNTGPLLHGFRKFINADEEEADKIEDMLLVQLDENKCKPLVIENYKFYLINIARIENINFAGQIINKICKDELWEKCEDCSAKEKCPILFNKICVSENSKSVKKFVENFYFWLQENDKRVTIRQIISQISFAFTGNLTCSMVQKEAEFSKPTYKLFNYNFANLFFGYKGINTIESTEQIKGITLLNGLNLDRQSLEEDYKLFVEEKFDCFPENIKSILKPVWETVPKITNYFDDNEESKNREEIQQKMRRSVRRFFIMYMLHESEEELNNLYSQLYGDIFVQYEEAVSQQKLSRKAERYIKDIIFEALYIENIGIPPENNNDLYLTLKRNDSAQQNAFLLLGTANKKDFLIQIEAKNTDIEDVERRNILKLNINRQESFQLTLPLLKYFASIVEGEINTNLNPALSHGLSKLNALILNVYRNNEEDNKMSIVFRNGSEIEEKNIDFDGTIYIG